jgi:hypothetical protein
MKFQIGWLTLGDGDPDNPPNPGPKNAVWHRTNVVVVEPIPGKGKKSITVRTSDITLYDCDLTVRSITATRYFQLKLLCELGGPFVVNCNHGILPMYIMDWVITHDEKDKEMPLHSQADDDGTKHEPLNEATWVIKLQEAND